LLFVEIMFQERSREQASYLQAIKNEHLVFSR
jgi:hypothetical protein